MGETVFETVAKSVGTLKLDLDSAEFATWAAEHEITDESLQAIAGVFGYLAEKKTAATIRTILKTSGLPLKNPKTFQNFDFSVITSKDVDRLRSLPSLAALYGHKNIAFIGPAGTGKTHLAQAFGYECCQRGLKTYFIKMSELRDKLCAARRNGTVSRAVAALVRPSCLIIDEVGHCEFDKENTRLFFDIVDRRYNKEGIYNMVFTSNKSPNRWTENFNEDDALLCALDRIFDDATVFAIKGQSFRGKKLDTVSLQTSLVKAPDRDDPDLT